MAAKTTRKDPVERKEGDERKKALNAALASIEKQFGKGAIMRMADGVEQQNIEVVSTGSLGLDLALGVGGLPRGRIVEIYGPESSGKTTLSLQVIAEMQKIGGTCAFVDAEHALDIQYAQRLGVNVPELLLSQPDAGEQALEIVDALVRSGSIDLIVVDSVAALTPRSEIEGDMGDALPGLQARLMSQALRKLTDERDKLAAENAQLQTQLTGLQARLIQVQADNDALTEQVNTLAQEGSDLADQLKAAEAARAEAAAQPQPAPEAGPIEEEPAAETPEAPAQEPSLTEKELTAYRRAEQTERNAAVRARRIYTQLSNLCEDARSRYLDSGEEIAALAADLSTGLARLQDAFAEVQVIFDDAQNAFDDMQLPETGAEETEEEA